MLVSSKLEEGGARHHGLLVGAHGDHVLGVEDLVDAQVRLRGVEGLGRGGIRVGSGWDHGWITVDQRGSPAEAR